MANAPIPTKEEEIISAIITKLQGITVANGYLTDIGSNVNDFNDKTIPVNTSEYLEVRDAQTNFVQKGEDGYLENAHKQQLLLEIFVQFEKKDITYSRKAAADIYKLIGTEKWYFWDNHRIRFIPLRHQKTVNQEDREISALKVFVICEFITAEWGVEETV